MEITTYCLFSLWCFLLFYITYAKRSELNDFDAVIIKLFMGIFFFALGLFSLSIEQNLPNGSMSSYTPIATQAMDKMWLQGLVICYVMFGVIQIASAGMDGMTLARKPKSDDSED